MSSTALRATTSRTFARRASTVATLAVIAFAASVGTGGVAQAVPSTQGSHTSPGLAISIGDPPAPGAFLHPDCGVCIL